MSSVPPHSSFVFFRNGEIIMFLSLSLFFNGCTYVCHNLNDFDFGTDLPGLTGNSEMTGTHKENLGLKGPYTVTGAPK